MENKTDLQLGDLPAFMRESWTGVSANLEKVDDVYQKRRAVLARQFPRDHLQFESGGFRTRVNDTHYRFRANSNFLYLVGISVPNAVLEITPDGECLYVPADTGPGTDAYWMDRDNGGLWVGPRPCLDEITRATGIPARTSSLLGELGASHDNKDVLRFLSNERLTKDGFEVQQIKNAVTATAKSFTDMVNELSDGVREAWLEGTFTRGARSYGSDVGYLPIVGSGTNACILHWMENSGVCKKGELVLVDAGVEVASGYTADVTRTLPVSGKYSAVQKEVHDAVSRAHKAAVCAVAPNVPFRAPHEAASRVLAEFLLSAGILKGTLEEILEKQVYRRYTLHGTSHMLGLDVHDCPDADETSYTSPLKPGVVLTVEPGLYFQPNDETVPQEFRGLGVRTEDDVLVTADGHENLSAILPSTSHDIEAWLGGLQ